MKLVLVEGCAQEKIEMEMNSILIINLRLFGLVQRMCPYGRTISIFL